MKLPEQARVVRWNHWDMATAGIDPLLNRDSLDIQQIWHLAFAGNSRQKVIAIPAQDIKLASVWKTVSPGPADTASDHGGRYRNT
jgi:hypothetical protein